MLDFGEELTIETFKIPWLIWIQILILILLILLLYCFSLFSSDLDISNSRVKNSSAPSSSLSIDSTGLTLVDAKPVHKFNSTVTHRFQPSQVGGSQNIKGEIATSTGKRIVRGEENTERDASSSGICYHPCHYFRLAREAFLKCLGLDSEKSSNSEQRKDR